MRVLGVDAYKGGWVAVRLTVSRVEAVIVSASLADLAATHHDCETIGVDMPIGLPVGGAPRECDQPAKDFIGPRRNSVFPAPPKAVLEAASHKEASAMAKELTGKGVSQQAYALRAKITEVADVLEQDARIIEVHPEVSFRAMANEPLAFAKKSWNGQRHRVELLHNEGLEIPDQLADPVGRVPVDDLLDAAAAAWSARRYAMGDAEAFPPGAQAGARPVIWR